MTESHLKTERSLLVALKINLNIAPVECEASETTAHSKFKKTKIYIYIRIFSKE